MNTKTKVLFGIAVTHTVVNIAWSVYNNYRENRVTKIVTFGINASERIHQMEEEGASPGEIVKAFCDDMDFLAIMNNKREGRK